MNGSLGRFTPARPRRAIHKLVDRCGVDVVGRATLHLGRHAASTLTDHLVVDTSLRIPTAKWAQTDDALSPR